VLAGASGGFAIGARTLLQNFADPSVRSVPVDRAIQVKYLFSFDDSRASFHVRPPRGPKNQRENDICTSPVVALNVSPKLTKAILLERSSVGKEKERRKGSRNEFYEFPIVTQLFPSYQSQTTRR
jgi:hypothetical protein